MTLLGPLALGVLLCLSGVVLLGSRADARHAAAGWQGPPPRPVSARLLGALAVALWLTILVAGLALVWG